MLKKTSTIQLHSPLSGLMKNFIHEKQACGYRYQKESHELFRLDRFLCEMGLQSPELGTVNILL
jgi:integrase/recombinase XerD